jgi:hypothetical protein
MVKPPNIPETGPLKRYAEAINRVSDFAASMQILRGKSYRVRKTTSGQLLDFEKAKETQTVEGLVIQRFYIDEEYDDHLDCRRADTDGNPYGDTVQIAKPLALRVSTYDGETDTTLGGTFTISYQSVNARRFTDSAGRYWEEVLWPAYEIGASDIYACEPEGGAGLNVFGTDLTWLDMNLNARHFRPKMTQLATCVVENGVNVVKYIYVSGGPVQA